LENNLGSMAHELRRSTTLKQLYSDVLCCLELSGPSQGYKEHKNAAAFIL